MEFSQDSRNTLHRGVRKASYDKDVIYGILDATPICHVAFMVEGRPYVQPVNFGRAGNKLYIHGAHHNRMTTSLIEAGEASLNVMLLDALVLARAAYNHSVNFRSAVVFGKVRELTDPAEKLEGLKALLNHFYPDRWDHCRQPDDKELHATRVIEITIETASAKIADAGVDDKPEDLYSGYTAGIIPVTTVYGELIKTS